MVSFILENINDIKINQHSIVMTTVEIIVFEYNEIYGYKTVPVEKAFDTYIKICLDYIPRYTEGSIGHTDKTIYYTEQGGYDKSRTILMICDVTEELVERITQRLRHGSSYQMVLHFITGL